MRAIFLFFYFIFSIPKSDAFAVRNSGLVMRTINVSKPQSVVCTCRGPYLALMECHSTS